MPWLAGLLALGAAALFAVGAVAQQQAAAENAEAGGLRLIGRLLTSPDPSLQLADISTDDPVVAGALSGVPSTGRLESATGGTAYAAAIPLDGGWVVEVQHPVRGPFRTAGNPVKLSASPTTITPSPLLGQHREEILKDLGYGDADIAALAKDGAI